MTWKAVFFDLDDTLHDSMKPFQQALVNLFPDKAKTLPVEQFYQSTRHYSDLLWEEYENNRITLKELRMKRIQLAGKDFGLNISNDEALCFQQEYEQRQQSLTLFPDAANMLTALKSNNYIIGIITNGPVNHQWKKIESLQLTKWFDKELIFISDAVGFAKPNANIFQTAAKKVKLPPKNILYIGDSWANDVVGALSAGWHAIWMNHRNRQAETDHKPLAVINRHCELYSILNIERSRYT